MIELAFRKLVLHFPSRLIDQPIVCNLVKKFDLIFNILRASITPREEGILVMQIEGEEQKLKEGIEYLENLGVKVQPLSQDITRNDDRCTQCGACVVICPAGALYLETSTRRVIFDQDKCIACELCIKACPPRAMEIHY